MERDLLRIRELVDGVTDPSVPAIPGAERIRRTRAARETWRRARAASALAGADLVEAPPAGDPWEELAEILDRVRAPSPDAPAEAEHIADALEDLEEFRTMRGESSARAGATSPLAATVARLDAEASRAAMRAHGAAEELQGRARRARYFLGRRRRRIRRKLQEMGARIQEALDVLPPEGEVRTALAALAAAPGSEAAWTAALDALEGRLEDLRREDLLRRADALLGGAGNTGTEGP